MPPDVKLKFIYPNSPALILYNDTSTPAQNALYSFGLWNLDSPPDQMTNPLPVPSAKADYVRSHEAVGPQNIFDAPGVKSRLKAGDRIFGFVTVSCPDCKTRREYWLSIKWGDSGWFSELDADKHVDMFSLSKEIPRISKSFDAFVSDIPLAERHPVLTVEEFKNANTH